MHTYLPLMKAANTQKIKVHNMVLVIHTFLLALIN